MEKLTELKGIYKEELYTRIKNERNQLILDELINSKVEKRDFQPLKIRNNYAQFLKGIMALVGDIHIELDNKLLGDHDLKLKLAFNDEKTLYIEMKEWRKYMLEIAKNTPQVTEIIENEDIQEEEYTEQLEFENVIYRLNRSADLIANGKEKEAYSLLRETADDLSNNGMAE